MFWAAVLVVLGLASIGPDVTPSLAREATSDEVKDLRREASVLKEVVAELTLENQLLRKSVTAEGEDGA